MQPTKPLMPVATETTAFIYAEQLSSKQKWGDDLELCMVTEEPYTGHYVVRRGVNNATANQMLVV